MYIKSARITNIRSIEDFEITFDEPAGWHVLIGDNGSGKSTIIRSLALALVGPDEAPGLRADWRDWLSVGEEQGRIDLKIETSEVDGYVGHNKFQLIPNIVIITRNPNNAKFFNNEEMKHEPSTDSSEYNWDNQYGWFSVAYGPYRKFTGGDQQWNQVFSNQKKLGAHLSAFGDNVALSEPIEWLVDLNYKEIEKFTENLRKSHDKNFGKNSMMDLKLLLTMKSHQDTGKNPADLDSTINGILEHNIGISYSNLLEFSIIDCLKKLVNTDCFLPNNTKLEKISSEGVFFKDGNGHVLNVNQLSSGYVSAISLTFELIRQLIRVYGEEAVFKNIREDKMYIDLPGVVLIDEIDAHLHPTWQTKIGQWFLKYFPNLQFIVTTHSPLVCRAAEKGTIWKLAAPGSEEKSGQVTGLDRNRLIYGNVLDAYGTEEFGIVDNTKSVDKKEELVQLSKKQITGKSLPTKKPNCTNSEPFSLPMLPLNSKPIATETHTHLASVQQQINNEPNFEAQLKRAKSKWDNKTSGRGQVPFADVKSTLLDACVGVEMCVYCEQNEATDIEHIFPKRLYPEKAFTCENYVLACGNCNTHYKCSHLKIFNPTGSTTEQDITPQKGIYIKPVNDDALFINQRIEDPMDYLELDLVNGLFIFTEKHPSGTREFLKAQYTKDLLGLNTRDALVKTRAAAAKFYVSRLEKYTLIKRSTTFQDLVEAINDDFGGVNQTADFTSEKDRILASIKDDILNYAQPTVWKEMMRQRHHLLRTNRLINQATEVLTW